MQDGQGVKTRAWVISDGHTASTDYFLFPYLERLGYSASLIAQDPVDAAVNDAKFPSLIAISRYLPFAWASVLAKAAQQGVKVVYFMDDDLFDWHVLSGLPWRYRLKIARLALLPQNRLMQLCSEFWVSTPYLAEKYAHLSPLTLTPIPQKPHVNAESAVRICYHGTASHGQEIAWLKEVIAEVHSASEHTHFELFGDAVVRQQFRSIPRVSVMHAMSWPDYLAWSSVERRDIALAPLLSGGFNAARGPTKFFDYTRLGAVGIYSDTAPYRGYIDDGIDGILLENRPEYWVETILALVIDSDKRAKMLLAAENRLQLLAGGLL